MPRNAPPDHLPTEVRDRSDVARACSDWDVGRLFRLVNNLTDGPHRFTASHIARRCGLSPSRVAEYMKGEHRVASAAVVLRVADGLGIPRERFELDRRAQPAEPPCARREGPGEFRRRAMLVGGLAATLPVLNLDELVRLAAALDDARRYMDGPVSEYFHRQLDACARSDGAAGPSRTLPSVLGIIAAVESGARQAKAKARRELLGVAARAGELAAWLYRDLGELVSTAHWHERATEWAQECGDAAMQGYLLLKRSQAAWDERDGARMLAFAEAAQHRCRRLPRRVLAEVTQQQARALAMTGASYAAVARKLDQAHAILGRVPDGPGGEDGSGLSAHYSPALLELQSAICQVEAGRPELAIEIYRARLDSGRFSRRDQAYFSVLMAQALAAAGEPDEAARLGRGALEVAVATRSTRTLGELGRLTHQLQAWRECSAVQGLCDALG
ncbi:helix-turn-helix transcriptional regulator [Actinospica durhamensis]|uniref:Helix-turn-helix transcriptional regulator n=1 Tax=Actinospica durhamensis TaxID=1508375 RepID=A0A941ELQ0_9ACTN|nr:helix-turn-helix domain-containing protein [Actinospica durhamensis]MBR7833957.1 helix-turn-helix transcriptional regulator [Actinospica durhamensis]